MGIVSNQPRSWLPKGFTYPGVGIVSEELQSWLPKNFTYPGQGFAAPSSVRAGGLNEFGIPEDLTYPGEGIAAPLPQASTAVTPQGNGFDFADAGVGAGVALGAIMLLAAAALATRRDRKSVV